MRGPYLEGDEREIRGDSWKCCSPFKLVGEVLCAGIGVEATDEEDAGHAGQSVFSRAPGAEGGGKDVTSDNQAEWPDGGREGRGRAQTADGRAPPFVGVL